MLEAFALSDTGLVRKGNEDGYICNQELDLFVVADGMGGHSAGEVASRLAVETVEGFIRRSHEEPDFSWPYGVDQQLTLGGQPAAHGDPPRQPARLPGGGEQRRLHRDGNDAHRDAGDRRPRRATATSATAGSTRSTSDGFRQITRDDTWVATILANDPTMTPADVARHPMRHVLTNVLGAREQVDVQVGEFRLVPGTLFLLCSDGLYGMVKEGGLESVLRAGGPLEAMGRTLIQAALDGGGHDNVTAVLVRNAGE